MKLKTILISLLLISFITSTINEVVYGTIEVTKSYPIGNLLHLISMFGWTLVSIILLIYLLWVFLLKRICGDLLNNPTRYYHCQDEDCEECNLKKIKPKVKKK